MKGSFKLAGMVLSDALIAAKARDVSGTEASSTFGNPERYSSILDVGPPESNPLA
jgi:hypothetical protein